MSSRWELTALKNDYPDKKLTVARARKKKRRKPRHLHREALSRLMLEDNDSVKAGEGAKHHARSSLLEAKEGKD